MPAVLWFAVICLSKEALTQPRGQWSTYFHPDRAWYNMIICIHIDARSLDELLGAILVMPCWPFGKNSVKKFWRGQKISSSGKLLPLLYYYGKKLQLASPFCPLPCRWLAKEYYHHHIVFFSRYCFPFNFSAEEEQSWLFYKKRFFGSAPLVLSARAKIRVD